MLHLTLDNFQKRKQPAFHRVINSPKAEFTIKWFKLKAGNSVKPNPEGGRTCLPETEDYNKKTANLAKTES